MNANKRIVFFIVFVVIAVTLTSVIRQGLSQPKATYSQFLRHVESGEVARATIAVAAGAGADQISYTLKNGSREKTVVPSDDREAMSAMRDKMVNIEIRDASSPQYKLLVNAVPFFVLLGFWIFM